MTRCAHAQPSVDKLSVLTRHKFKWLECNPILSPLQVLVAQKVTMGVYKGVTTSELDDLAAETAASMTATHPDYATVCVLHCITARMSA